jgi:ppGpp synthetase/RelA/SpoT-type nucleotidyltranferase
MTREIGSAFTRERAGLCQGAIVSPWMPGEPQMASWTALKYNRGRVDAAGDALIAETTNENLPDDALAIVDNWRMSHHYPLQIIKMNLLKWANKVDADALVYQRIKRLTSIESKLRRHRKMKLSQMQDIGGCRSVVNSATQVAALAGLYERRADQRPDEGSQFVKKFDYIAQPKEDGYRSLHLVYKYRTKTARWQSQYNGLRVEIQIRSRLQHAWASAVETVDTFTSQSLKSNVGSAQWKRFFALMGSDIAMREKGSAVPGTPASKSELREEIAHLVHELKVETVLGAWNVSAQNLNTKDARIFVLVLDPEESSLRASLKVWGYRAHQLQGAQRHISEVEKRNPRLNAVLVKAESLRALRRAFPSYYLDAGAFMTAVKRAVA